MELKKSKKANLETRRGTHLLLGMVISLALVWMAFEYKSYDHTEQMKAKQTLFMDDDEFVIQTERPKEIKPPEVKPVSTVDIVDNTVDVPDINIDVEIDPDDEIDTYTLSSDEPDDDVEPEFFVIVQNQPEFPGGEAKLMEYLSNIEYPQRAIAGNIQGTVYVSFIVNKDGSISHVKIIRGIGSGCDEETLRIIKAMPKWKPGRQMNTAVAVKVRLPVRFTLGE